MNIFVLDKDQSKAALYTCDRHVVKMLVETAQILSTVHHLRNSSLKNIVYKPTHIKHPCVIWCNQNIANYKWLIDLFVELEKQYELRYNKKHLSFRLLYVVLKNTPSELPEGDLTDFAMAMPEKYKSTDVVESYRNYYIGEKAKFATW